MSTAPQPLQTFDPDVFMAQRGQQSAPQKEFDPDEFMAQRQSPSNDPLVTGQGMEQAAQTQAARQRSATVQPISRTRGILAPGPKTLGPVDQENVEMPSALAMSGQGPGLSGLAPNRTPRVMSEKAADDMARNSLVTAGAVVAPMFAPEAGILASAGLSGAGAGAGNVASQSIAGKNPIEPANLAETGKTAAMMAAGAVGGGLVGKGIDAAASRFGPSVKTALNLSNRALFPREIPVGDEPDLATEFGRVAKGVAPYTRKVPLQTGPGGALRSAQQVRQAAQNIWNENVQPVIESYGHVARPTDDIAASIRSTISDTDRQVGSPRVDATEKLADIYDGGTRTVKQMADRVTELNNDKAVSRFQNMDANQQSQALLGDPSLRGKVAELNTLRDKLFNTISDEGGDALGNQFQEARKDWGALRNYEDRILNAKVPTPQPLINRAANTFRATLSPRGAHVYTHPTDTFFRWDNPNRLVPKALNMAGKVPDLASEPVVIQGRSQPFTSPRRMLGTGGGSIVTPPPADTSGSVEFTPPPVESTSRAQRKGLLLPESTERPAPKSIVTPAPVEETQPLLEGAPNLPRPVRGLLAKQNVTEVGPRQPLVPGQKPLLPEAPQVTRMLIEEAENPQPPAGKRIRTIAGQIIGPNGEPLGWTGEEPLGSSSAAAQPGAPNLNEPRARLAELNRQFDNLNQQMAKARSFNVRKSLIAKQKRMSVERNALRADLGLGDAEDAGSSESTYDNLPAEERKWIDSYSKEIEHLPQALREAEVRDLQKYAGNIKGMSRKELLARRVMAERNPPKFREPGEEEAPF